MQIEERHRAILVDLYELTMAQAYFDREMFAPATFSLFIRKYPSHRGYFVSAGAEEVVEYLESFRYSDEDLTYLKSTGLFSTEFLDYLAQVRFTGNVHAIPEGRLFFKNEPIVEVTAPIIEGQLAETYVINAINLPVTIASKAARCYHAAEGRGLVDFSLRRTQGADAGMAVARSSYIAGFDATSNVAAGKLYGLPTSGTMAHSFVMSFEDEMESFRAFARTFGDQTVLLIDTYDTLSGAEKAVEVAREMKSKGRNLRGVRLDSGDMVELSRKVRRILDESGFEDVQIFASGSYDEYEIARSIAEGARIDAFGVGTKMGVSADTPYTDIAYKLVQYDERPVLKLSSGKKSLVAEKQVFRMQSKGRYREDTIGLRHEKRHGEPLLVAMMEDGGRLQEPDPAKVIRDRFMTDFERFDDRVRAIESPAEYPVRISDELQKLQDRIVEETRRKELDAAYRDV
ncbi:MAG TPA: nicotinate phosphoribosyltransferase [Desulfobacterales bacterium]